MLLNCPPGDAPDGGLLAPAAGHHSQKCSAETQEQATHHPGKHVMWGKYTLNMQEVLGPIYFMAIIVILKLTLTNPYFPAVTTSPGPQPSHYTAALLG